MVDADLHSCLPKSQQISLSSFHDDTQILKYVSVFQFHSYENTLHSRCYVKNEKQSSVLPDLIKLSD